MKLATIALVVCPQDKSWALAEVLSDDREIEALQAALNTDRLHLQAHLLAHVHAQRERIQKEDEDFGDYVEELLSNPFIRTEIKEHGIQWFKSKIRLEQYQKTERAAVETIAGFAFQTFCKDPSKTDFILAAPKHQVRVLIYQISDQQTHAESA